MKSNWTLVFAAMLLACFPSQLFGGQPTDIDNDGRSELIVVRIVGGQMYWYITPVDNDTSRMPAHYNDAVLAGRNAVWVAWGRSGDQPLLADVSGDGLPEFIVYRPSEGNWYILWSGWNGSLVVHFPGTGLPQAVQFDDDGKADLAFIDILNQRGTYRSSKDGTINSSPFDYNYGIGNRVYIDLRVVSRFTYPMVSGEWGAITEPYMYNHGKGTKLFRQFSGTVGVVGENYPAVPLFGDFIGGPKIETGNFIGGRWQLWSQGDWELLQTEYFGIAGDIPINGDFDGDGKIDKALWRQETVGIDSTYYIKFSSPNSASQAVSWGWAPHAGGFSCKWGFNSDTVMGRFEY
ncbi:MAG: hypothetical protein KDB03_04985 [Planctomycetales bacterium]|nr:hypothetical protein [Planctomycetales bacterium]